MLTIHYILSALVAALFQGQPDKTRIIKHEFDIFNNDKLIGQVTAMKLTKGSKVIEDLHTVTNSKVLMVDIHVESEINLVYKNKVLSNGVAYRYANRGNEDVESRVTRVDKGSYSIERNGKKRTLKTGKIDFCVVDLYFTEPVNRKVIFSTMYAQYLTLTPAGQGRYRTQLPDNRVAVYIYRKGQLESVEVEMTLGKVITKRRSPSQVRNS